MQISALQHEPKLAPRLKDFVVAAALCIVALTSLSSPVHAALGIANLPYTSPGASPGVTIFNFYCPDSGISPSNPTVILVHGGGYFGGNRWEFQTLAPALADLGFNVLCPEYTLATPAQPSFPQAVIDTLALIRAVRSDALGLNLSHVIILGGTSAGATIGATAAYGAEHTRFTSAFPPAPPGLRPDAFVGVYGRYDILWNSVTPPAPWLPGSVFTYLGSPADGQTMADLFAAASAVTYVDQCAPPSALYHGDADGVVPVQNTQRLDARLRAWSIPVWTTIIPGGGHDTTTMPYGAAGAAIIADIIPTLLSAPSPNCPRNAPIPTGACCSGASCALTSPDACAGPSQRFIGLGVACNPSGDLIAPCCRADFTQDDVTTIDDLFQYLNAWFAVSPSACLGSLSSPTIDDLFLYLNVYFTGC